MAVAIFIHFTTKRLQMKENNRQSAPAKAIIKMKYDDVEGISCLNLIKTVSLSFPLPSLFRFRWLQSKSWKISRNNFKYLISDHILTSSQWRKAALNKREIKRREIVASVFWHASYSGRSHRSLSILKQTIATQISADDVERKKGNKTNIISFFFGRKLSCGISWFF